MNIPMILIREIQKPTGHAPLLQRIEQSNPIRHRYAIILVTVDDELGGAVCEDAAGAGWIRVVECVARLPEGAVELYTVKNHHICIGVTV